MSTPRLSTLQLVRNYFTSRAAALARLLDPRRNLDAECGYPTVITPEDYKSAFKREDIASRVVNVWPQETWSEPPEVLENEEQEDTPFEVAWKALQKKHTLYSILERADTLSGIGRYGIVLLGLSDGKLMQEPVVGISAKGLPEGTTPKNELLYLRTFEENLVTIDEYEKDITNPRYGHPVFYTIKLVDPTSGQTEVTRDMKVHWSRVVHLADNRTNSDIFGAPRMEVVFNRLLDLKKVGGGSAEMFWKGGFPGLSLETQPSPEGDYPEIDEEATKAQMESYMEGLKRYIATTGMTVRSLSPQISEPTAHVDVQLKIIAATIGVPWRVFTGSEAAQLASEQDGKTWNRRLTRRRQNYATPFVLTPFIDRLIMAGVLPKPSDYHVTWPDINAPSAKDKADIGEKLANALAKYVVSGAGQMLPPRHFLTRVLGFDDLTAQTIIDEAANPEGVEEPPEPKGSQSKDGGNAIPKKNAV